MKPKFFGIIKNNKIILNNPEEFGNYTLKFKDDTEVEMTIARKYKRRTSGLPGEETNFLGYWWGVIIKMVAAEMGELDIQYVHEIILTQIGHCRVDEWANVHPKETKDLSGGEFADLCSRARIWASQELNLSIPEPNECDYSNY